MTQQATIASNRSWLVHALGPVAEAMTRTVIRVPPDLEASQALAYLYRSGVGGAPVVEDGRVAGVVTISDLAAPRPFARESGPFLRPHDGGPEWQVRDLMTESAVTASPDEPLTAAVIKMARAHVDRLPVVDGDERPIGIVARDDVVRVLARAAAREERGTRSLLPVLVPD